MALVSNVTKFGPAIYILMRYEVNLTPYRIKSVSNSLDQTVYNLQLLISKINIVLGKLDCGFFCLWLRQTLIYGQEDDSVNYSYNLIKETF